MRVGKGIKNGMMIAGEDWFRLPKGRVVEIAEGIEGIMGRYRVFRVARRDENSIRLSISHPGLTEKSGRRHWSGALTISRITEKQRQDRIKAFPGYKFALCDFSFQSVVGVVRPKAFLATYYDALTEQSKIEGR